MNNLRPLIEMHIRASIPEFSEVLGASGLDNIISGRLTNRGCYIFKASTVASPNNVINAIAQKVTLTFAVLIVVRNVLDIQGGDADDDSSELQESLQSCLVGWSPDGMAAPMTYGGGALVSFKNGLHIWKETFITQQYLRAEL